jgi:hypothetical protein
VACKSCAIIKMRNFPLCGTNATAERNMLKGLAIRMPAVAALTASTHPIPLRADELIVLARLYSRPARYAAIAEICASDRLCAIGAMMADVSGLFGS